MSFRDNKVTRRIALGAIAGGFVGSAFILYSRKKTPLTDDFGPKKVELLDVPIPEKVMGPFGMQACLSPDGKTIAVAGNMPNSVLQQQIFIAPSTVATLSEYQPVYSANRICFILAMAFSPSEPRQLAFIAREAEKELPANLDELSPKEIQQLLGNIQEHRLRDTLYIVNADGGLSPRELATLHNNASLKDTIFGMSLCWAENQSALFCFDGEYIFRVSLDGKQEAVYQKGNGHHIVGSLTSRLGGLTSFIDYYVRNLQKKKQKKFEIPELVSIDNGGTIRDKQTLSHFPLFGEECYNSVVIGKDKWAYCHRVPGKNNRFLLYVIPIFRPTTQRVYEISCGGNLPCYLKFYAFTPDGQELFAGKKVNCSKSTLSQKPSDILSQLCRIRL